MEIHQNVAILAPLLGTWSGQGQGSYPTIQDFSYVEEITFGHVGKPFLSYRQVTKGNEGQPLHSESGYLRIPGPGRAEFVVAMPTGHVEVGTGAVHGANLQLILDLTAEVHQTGSAKDVTQVKRTFRLEAGTLSYTLAMAAVGQPLTHHLSATLHRVD